MWKLEQRVTAGHLGDPEQFLEEMFRARHGLLTVKTMAALSREVYARMAKIHIFGHDRGQFLLEDTVDQFDRLRAMADGQKDYLQGTIEFYQARTNTKMTIAAERLAVIAAVTLPITALSSILGMNVIVNDETQYGPLAVALVIMIVMSIIAADLGQDARAGGDPAPVGWSADSSGSMRMHGVASAPGSICKGKGAMTEDITSPGVRRAAGDGRRRPRSATAPTPCSSRTSATPTPRGRPTRS